MHSCHLVEFYPFLSVINPCTHYVALHSQNPLKPMFAGRYSKLQNRKRKTHFLFFYPKLQIPFICSLLPSVVVLENFFRNIVVQHVLLYMMFLFCVQIYHSFFLLGPFPVSLFLVFVNP